MARAANDLFVIATFAVGLALSGRQFDFIDGKALDFSSLHNELVVDCRTDKGEKVILSDRCTINPDGGWCVTVDDGPQNVANYVLKIRPDGCLSKTFKVAVPKTGRPSLTIKRSEFVFGDLNGNNVVDSVDVLTVQDAIGIRKGDTEWAHCGKRINIVEPAEHFDFNHDEVVDAKDVAMVKVNLGKRGC